MIITFIICKGKWFIFCMAGFIFHLITCNIKLQQRFIIWQSVICCVGIFILAMISLSQTVQEGSYCGEFLVLQRLISFQESMTELNAGHHLSMGSNFEKKNQKTLHIGWKIYFKNGTGLKTIKASWEVHLSYFFSDIYCTCSL